MHSSFYKKSDYSKVDDEKKKLGKKHLIAVINEDNGVYYGVENLSDEQLKALYEIMSSKKRYW